jgi:signal transduction histidine kinase
MSQFKLGDILGKVRHAVVGVFDLEELQEHVVDLCMEIFGAEACSLFLRDEKRDELVMVSARGYSARFLRRPAPLVPRSKVIECPVENCDKLGITGWIASTGRPFMSNTPEEHRAHPHWTGQYDIQQFGPDKRVHNFYGVPLAATEDDVLGVLKVEGKRENGEYQPFTETDANLFDILASHIALAISDARRVEDIHHQREQLKTITNALHKVVASLSEELPMQYLLNEIVATTAEVLSAEACVLFLIDAANPNRLTETAGKGYVAHLIGKAEYDLISPTELVAEPQCQEDRVGLTAWIAITGRPFLARNNEELRAHPHWRGRYDPEHYPEGSGKKCFSFLGLPLRVSDRVVGVLKVENKRLDDQYVPFTDQDQQLFETLARTIAIAIGTVQEQRVKREQRVTDAMYRVSQALAGRFELNPLLDEIVAVGMEIFDAETCVVYLVDPTNPSRLIETAGKGYSQPLIGKAEYRLVPKEALIERPEDIKDRVGLTAWIAITGQPFLARDNDELRAHPHWRGKYDPAHYPAGSGRMCYSFLGLPLRVGDEVLGVLKVENKNVGGRYIPFDEREQHIFRILANSAAIAIHNARELQSEFQQARELAAIGQSAAAMAHRMGTPLQEIRTTAELLLEDLQANAAVSEQSRQDVQDVIERVDQMADAIVRVRKAVRPLQPVRESCNINSLVRSSFTENRSFASQIQERNIRTELLGLEQIGDRFIWCDRNLLEEAVSNLVSNALDAVSIDGSITVNAARSEDDLRIQVRDDGPGVEESRIANLFLPFKTTKKGGLGLGLFIARRNIEAHGGSVGYHRLERGSCFQIDIPWVESHEV